MNIIFIAPPAAGKGTQSSLLEEKYGYIHISTGDLLREEINKKSNIGTEIEKIISTGEFVSDEIITELLKSKLENIKSKKFILDGYPRNNAQGKILDDIFKELNIDNYIVIYLDLDYDIAKKRALGRMICSKCKTGYNKYFQDLMPKENEICDKCQGKLTQRSDDNEETFKNRFDKFLELTNPVLKFYKTKEKLHIINANLTSEEIFKNIEKVLEECSVNN